MLFMVYFRTGGTLASSFLSAAPPGATATASTSRPTNRETVRYIGALLVTEKRWVPSGRRAKAGSCFPHRVPRPAGVGHGKPAGERNRGCEIFLVSIRAGRGIIG